MSRSVPQVVSVAAAAIGVLLFALTLYYIDLDETVASARQLGLAFPLILIPGTCWHLLRTWGWAVAFPDGSRPAFTRLFRVRLAADAIAFFTVRGIAGEPLKVLLLYDRVAPGSDHGRRGAGAARLRRHRHRHRRPHLGRGAHAALAAAARGTRSSRC